MEEKFTSNRASDLGFSLQWELESRVQFGAIAARRLGLQGKEKSLQENMNFFCHHEICILGKLANWRAKQTHLGLLIYENYQCVWGY